MSKRAFDKIAAGMQAAIDYVDGDREGFVAHFPGIGKALGFSQAKSTERSTSSDKIDVKKV
jgi:hypothetical protein